MNNIIKKDALVFDIGANVGQSAICFVTHGAGRVISVEPCIENFIALMQVPKTIPIHAACWRNSEIIPISYALNRPGLSSALKGKWNAIYRDIYWCDERHVPAITLDQLRMTFGFPDVVKVDVEGAELMVLQGMNFKPDILIFEFHKEYLDETAACIEQCMELGFTKGHYVRDDMDLTTTPTTLIKEFKERLIGDNPDWGNITLI